MAEKEATVYIIDVGKSMGECRHGRSVTDLEWAMRYVWDRITTTVCNLWLLDVSIMPIKSLTRLQLAEKPLRSEWSHCGQTVCSLLQLLGPSNQSKFQKPRMTFKRIRASQKSPSFKTLGSMFSILDLLEYTPVLMG